jgi:hypothetical protein
MSAIRQARLRTCAAVAVLFAVTAASPCFGGPILPTVPAKAVEGFTVKNPDPMRVATDFHLVIQSLSPSFFLFGTENLDVTGTAGPMGSAPFIQGSGTTMLTVDWSLLAVPPGGSAKFGVEITQKNNEIRITSAGFTYPGGSFFGVVIPSFAAQGDPVYIIGNDFSVPIGIHNLEFLVDVPEIPLGSLDPGAMPGFGSPLPDFTLAPNSAMTFNVPGNLQPGNFLYAQGDVFDVSTGLTVLSFIQGHQAAVPETGTFGLLGIGCIGIVAYIGRRRISDQQSASDDLEARAAGPLRTEIATDMDA